MPYNHFAFLTLIILTFFVSITFFVIRVCVLTNIHLFIYITGRPIRNFVIVPSEPPLATSELSLPTRINLNISVFDQMGVPVETTIQVQLSKYTYGLL